MKIRDWFEKNFAGGFARIHDPSNLGEEKITEGHLPWFLSSEGTGALQVSCGGEAILGFSLPLWSLPKEPRNANVFLIRDETEARKWECDPRESWRRGPKPHARLTLVMTA